MLQRVLHTASMSVVLIAGMCTLIGVAAGENMWLDALHSASIGVVAGIAYSIHYLVRTLAGRTPEAAAICFAPDSVERRVFVTALAKATPDVLGILVFAAFIGLFQNDAASLQGLLGGVLRASMIDVVVRVRKEWLVTIGEDAQQRTRDA